LVFVQMKGLIVYLLAVSPCCVTLGQAAGTASSPARASDGFLPVQLNPVNVAPVTNTVQRTVSTGTNSSPTVGGYVLDDKHKLLPGDRVSFQIIEDRT